MNLNISSQQFWSYLRQLAAATGIGTQFANLGHLGTGRWVTIGGGILLLIVEHYLGDPSTGNTPAKVTTLSQSPVTSITTAPHVTLSHPQGNLGSPIAT